MLIYILKKTFYGRTDGRTTQNYSSKPHKIEQVLTAFKERFHENWIFLVFGRYFGLPCFTFWSTTGLPWTTPDFYYLLS